MQGSYSPRVTLYPDTVRMYMDAASPTLKVVYFAYFELPLEFCRSTRNCETMIYIGLYRQVGTSFEEGKGKLEQEKEEEGGEQLGNSEPMEAGRGGRGEEKS